MYSTWIDKKGQKMKEISIQKLVVFKWYFPVVDIIEILTDSGKPRDYWYRLKKLEKEGSGVDLSTICRQLKFESKDGKKYSTDSVNHVIKI